MLGSCSINKVILMGRLTADPELRQTPQGVSTCQFTVAVTRSYQNQNGERQSDFINVVAWRQTAEFVCRYFTKGRIILVEGELRTRTYDDKRYPEVRHYVTEVVADNVAFGETKASANGGSGNGYQNSGTGGGYQSSYQSGGAGNGYQSGGAGSYHSGGRNNDSVPPSPGPHEQVAVSDLSDFEDVISEKDLPF